MTAVMVQPPGQMELFPPPPQRARPPWRVLDAEAVPHGPVHNLTMAAAVASTLAAEQGDAWLVAGDGSACHVSRDGTVTPTSGWPAAAARVIRKIRATPTQKGNR